MIARSYDWWCSDGGREGMVETKRDHAGFNGYIVGDPFFVRRKFANQDLLRVCPYGALAGLVGLERDPRPCKPLIE